MNMEERLQAVVAQAETDGALWHTIIHGDSNTSVPTENGNVPTVAKQMADVRAEVISNVTDYLGKCQTAKNETQQLKAETQAIKEQTATLKSETLALRNEAETFKDLSQTTFNSISSTTTASVSLIQTEGQTQVANVNSAGATQIALATEQADRAEQATSSKVDVDLSNITKQTIFAKLFTTYSNGTTWYRVWPDGWIEQGGVAAAGGTVTVTFPKAFKNTNYTVVATSLGTNSEIYAQCITKTSASQITIYNKGGAAGMQKNWYACGF